VENAYITQVPGSILSSLRFNSSDETTNRLKYGASLVCGSYATWFRSHPQYLPWVVDFVAKGFSDSEKIKSSSALALNNICHDVGDLMVPYLPNLASFYMQAQDSLTKSDLIEVTEAMAGIICTLPDDHLTWLRQFTLPIGEKLAKVCDLTRDKNRITLKEVESDEHWNVHALRGQRGECRQESDYVDAGRERKRHLFSKRIG
jgi:hypothetical protein